METFNDGPAPSAHGGGGCPGSRATAFAREDQAAESLQGKRSSQLTHWPVQMHLLNPASPHFQRSDFLLAADCVAFALGDFHKDYLKGKTLGIACPKLDEGQSVYTDKLTALVEQAEINSLTVMIMQVPCCRGLPCHGQRRRGAGLAQGADQGHHRGPAGRDIAGGVGLA